MPAPQTQSSLGTDLSVWWAGLPLLCRAVFVLNTSVFVLFALMGVDPYLLCFNPIPVFTYGQVWRVFSAFVHSGIIHIALNMIAFLGFGRSLEHEIGSLPLSYLILLFVVLSEGLTTAISFAANAVGYSSFLFECGVGFSAVIFALLVVDTKVNAVERRSIFGLFYVPSQWYPWALLLLLQLMLPNVSFVGHLSGLLAGYAYTSGILRFAIPPARWFAALEQTSCCSGCRRYPAYIAASTALDSFGNRLPTSVRAGGATYAYSPLRSDAGMMSAPTAPNGMMMIPPQAPVVGRRLIDSPLPPPPPPPPPSSALPIPPPPEPKSPRSAGATAANFVGGPVGTAPPPGPGTSSIPPPQQPPLLPPPS